MLNESSVSLLAPGISTESRDECHVAAVSTRASVWSGLAALLGLAGSACVLMTDAATRLGEAIVENAAVLRRESGPSRAFLHRPRSWPAGCQAGYTVTFQESFHHPTSGGSLLVGCKGEANFETLGYSYSTTYHLNAVRVPRELAADKEAGTSLRVTLRKQGNAIEVVEVK